MSVLIVSEERASDGQWDAVWSECDYATYFHSREWAQIWSGHTRGSVVPDARMIRFSDGMQALLPLSMGKRRGGMINDHFSSPGGTYGGWIATDALDVQHAVLLNDFLLTKVGNLRWRLNPYNPLESLPQESIRTLEETQTLPLTPDFTELFKRWSRAHRAAVNKAAKAGVSVRLAADVDDWRAYFEVYQDSLRRWGDKASSQYEWSVFADILARNSPHARLWLALHDSKIVAGALCFYAKQHAVYWHGAALENAFQVQPVKLLFHDVIRHASEQGLRWFDFNPSGGHEGVRAFKRGFATEELACPMVSVETRWKKVLGVATHYFAKVMP
jgi:hypothetical protein